MSAARSLAVAEAPGDVLSPSSANLFRTCGAKWFYHHVRRLPDPKTGALLQGSCFHKALEANFLQKLETRRDLPTAAVVGVYRNAWTVMAPETEFRDDEDPAALRAQGEALTVKFLDQAAPWIDPAGVELPVSGQIGGVHVRGFVDLVDVHGRVIDYKTARDKRNPVNPDYRFQLATYIRLVPHASGEAANFILTKTKIPECVSSSYTVQPCDLVAVDRLYPAIQAAIRARVFLPNRAGQRCSRKYCAFWRACQADFGGEVPA
jgi:hypothetical protein